MNNKLLHFFLVSTLLMLCSSWVFAAPDPMDEQSSSMQAQEQETIQGQMPTSVQEQAPLRFQQDAIYSQEQSPDQGQRLAPQQIQRSTSSQGPSLVPIDSLVPASTEAAISSEGEQSSFVPPSPLEEFSPTTPVMNAGVALPSAADTVTSASSLSITSEEKREPRFELGKPAEISVTLYAPEPERGQMASYFALVAEFLNTQAKGAVKLEYVPGRGGADAINALSLRKTTTPTMAGIILPTFLLQPLLPDKRFEPSSVVPVAFLSGTPTVLWVSEKSPFLSLSDFISAVRSHPADSYVAGTGSNSGQHMTTYVFNRAAGVTLQYLPYMGSREAARAVVKGTAIACWGAGTPASFMKGLRPLAIASQVRSPFYPNTPTFMEKGVTMESSDQLGICMPASTEEDTLIAVSNLFVSMANDPEFQQKASLLGFAPSVVPYVEVKEYLNKIENALRTFLENYPMATQF